MLDSHAFQTAFSFFLFNQLGRKERGHKSVLIGDTLLCSDIGYLQGIFDAVYLCPKLTQFFCYILTVLGVLGLLRTLHLLEEANRCF